MRNDEGKPRQRDVGRSGPMRLWLWVPDWVFRGLGAVAFLVFIAPRLPMYFGNFWGVGAWYQSNLRDPATRVSAPWGQLLVDLTYLLIAISFIIRTAPRQRAARAREIVPPIIAAFWPFIPWWAVSIGKLFDAGWVGAYELFMINPSRWSPVQFICGTSLIILGNALDVWGYATLMRSLSIVAEARELKVRGPYRLVRHPIYLGQMFAQAGVWLFYANTHIVWVAFWAAFVAMQLFRSRIEDEVLARSFGEGYLAWKRKTFWFV